MYVSMALLPISTIQETGFLGDAVKLAWLVSIAVLAVLNAGAAFGVYVAAVALYAVLSFNGWGSVVERPDNYALLLVAGVLAVHILARRSARLWDRSMLVIVGFLGYGLLQIVWMGLVTRITFAAYMRMFGLPLLMFLLLAQHGFTLREFRALVRSLLVLGAYMALVSIAERAGWYDLIVPAWIATPTTSFVEASKNFSILTGRSGGLLMQSEFNGLALSLIYCVAVLAARVFGRTSRWLEWAVGLLCLVGVFLTYTRAAWLACAPASLALLWRPSATHATTYLKRFGLVAASTAIVLFLALLPDSFARQRIGEPDNVFVRLNLWRAGLSMAADRPLFGSGFNTFVVRLDDYQQEMTVGPRMTIRDQGAHNLVLSVLVELGTIGLVLYAGALAAVFRRARAGALHSWGREGTAWVAVFAGVYVLQAQFVNVHEPTTNLIFFGVMGAVAGLRLRDRVRHAQALAMTAPA
jgi:O-antigen ligase